MKSIWLGVALLAGLFGACNYTMSPGGKLSAFPVQPQSDGPYPTGLIEGFLVIETGCIRLQATSGEDYLIYWPYGYSYIDYPGEAELLDNAVIVLDGKGQEVVTVDDLTLDRVKIGGGELKQDVSNGVCGGIGISWLTSSVEVEQIPPP